MEIGSRLRHHGRHRTRPQLYCPICIASHQMTLYSSIYHKVPTEQYIILSYLLQAYPLLYLLSHLSLDKYASPRFLDFFRRQGPDRSQRLPPCAAYSFFAHWNHWNRQWLHSEEHHSEEPHLWADTTSVSAVAAKLLVILTISLFNI